MAAGFVTVFVSCHLIPLQRKRDACLHFATGKAGVWPRAVLSGMANPEKMLDFLALIGAYDPLLAPMVVAGTLFVGPADLPSRKCVPYCSWMRL